ncbi:radical SAM protein [Paenibacillus sp. M1]|uniref:Radical SAM protein n=1 Tax=Paenibacillus haidiansis TaxID=1574488 RepID=A0ABU7VQ92_9BACL
MKVAMIIPNDGSVSADILKNEKWEHLWEFQARKRLWSSPSLSLLTIAGMLPKDFDVDYIDLNYNRRITEQYELVFMSPSTPQTEAAYCLADELRANGTKVVMGGIHATVLPDEVLKHADTVFIGESEDTFSLFLSDLSERSTSRIYRSVQLPDLTVSPVPRYDLIRDYSYKSIPIQTSRGCPHQCDFCASSAIYGKKYRRKSIEQVKRELDAIVGIWPKPFIFFTDDNMFIDPRYSMELLKLLKQYGVRWYAFTDASVANKPELLKEMRLSGCSQLLIGFESLSNENLAQVDSAMWKRRKREDYARIIEIIQSHGIGVVGSFVLGFDADNVQTFEELYDFILETRLYATNITILTPFPGTSIHDKFVKDDRLVTKSWSSYNGFELTFKLRQLTHDEFIEAYDKLNERLNSRERIHQVINGFKKIYGKKEQMI